MVLSRRLLRLPNNLVSALVIINGARGAET
jgi:hypothetical protein